MIICDCCGEQVAEENLKVQRVPNSRTQDNPFGTREDWCIACSNEWDEVASGINKTFRDLMYIYQENARKLFIKGRMK